MHTCRAAPSCWRHDSTSTGVSACTGASRGGARAPVRLLNFMTAYLRVVMLPRAAGMVPVRLLLDTSKFDSTPALPMVLGIVPVSWLLYSVITCKSRQDSQLHACALPAAGNACTPPATGTHWTAALNFRPCAGGGRKISGTCSGELGRMTSGMAPVRLLLPAHARSIDRLASQPAR